MRYSHNTILAIALVMALASCDSFPLRLAEPIATPPPLFDRDTETYRVYASAIARWCGKGLVALNPESEQDNPSRSFDWFNNEFHHLNENMPADFERSTYDDYIREASAPPFVIDPSLDWEGEHVEFIVDDKFGQRFSVAGDWEQFEKLNPNHCGHVSLSQVGFNNIGTQAMVYYYAMAGVESCGGEHLLLQLAKDEWNIIADVVGPIC